MNLEKIYFEIGINNEVEVRSEEGTSSYVLFCNWSWVYGQEYENGIGCILTVDFGICLETYEDGTEEEFGFGVEESFLEKIDEKFTNFIYERHYEKIEERLQSDYYYYNWLINE